MRANSRSVTAVRKADGGNHRNPFPHATRPGLGREKDNYGGNLACPHRLAPWCLGVTFRRNDSHQGTTAPSYKKRESVCVEWSRLRKASNRRSGARCSASPPCRHAGGMRANSRSVNAVRKADGGNHRTPFPHATRPGLGREKDDYGGNLACPHRLAPWCPGALA